jgi:hypothetical protein
MLKITRATMKRKILQKIDHVILFAFNYDGCYFYLKGVFLNLASK